MIVEPTPLAGAMVVRTTRAGDERGSFARLFSRDVFEHHGLPTEFVQGSLSSTTTRGTLRGMHFQIPPSREGKLIRCLQGEIWDVIIDLRRVSETFGQHFGTRLSGETLDAVWAPHGFAHGHLALTDGCLVEYQMTDVYAPELAHGVRWNDPFFGIQWPIEPKLVNERDVAFPDFDPDTSGIL